MRFLVSFAVCCLFFLLFSVDVGAQTPGPTPLPPPYPKSTPVPCGPNDSPEDHWRLRVTITKSGGSPSAYDELDLGCGSTPSGTLDGVFLLGSDFGSYGVAARLYSPRWILGYTASLEGGIFSDTTGGMASSTQCTGYAAGAVGVYCVGHAGVNPGTHSKSWSPVFQSGVWSLTSIACGSYPCATGPTVNLSASSVLQHYHYPPGAYVGPEEDGWQFRVIVSSSSGNNQNWTPTPSPTMTPTPSPTCPPIGPCSSYTPTPTPTPVFGYGTPWPTFPPFPTQLPYPTFPPWPTIPPFPTAAPFPTPVPGPPISIGPGGSACYLLLPSFDFEIPILFRRVAYGGFELCVNSFSVTMSAFGFDWATLGAGIVSIGLLIAVYNAIRGR